MIVRNCIILLVFSGLFFACKHKKASLSGNDKVELSDFMDFFPVVKLPYQISDSIFNRDEPDSLLISYQIFTQFVTDTVLTKHFNKGSRPEMFALGKVKAGKNETYLFVKAVSSSKELAYIICFDKANKFVIAKPLFSYDEDGVVKHQAVMDNKYTLSVMHQRKNASGELIYKKDAYIYNDAGLFMLILTESNETTSKNKNLLNPIDTLPRKFKLSGDYLQDKLNLISVRDGRDASHIRFFVHFEKDNGTCKGELKGEARLINPAKAHYSSSGDPCSVDFVFTPSKVVIKELEGCGNYRDIKCFFEGAYLRQKEVKKKPAKKHR
jgi:hypothetical protein